jgi:16S rRNA processing protein RimM
MQHEEELVLFGLVLKTHGTDGQMVLRLFLLPDDELKKNEPVFVEIDGIPVPFFIRDFRFITEEGAIIHLDEINSSEEASDFVNCRIFIHKNSFTEKVKENINFDILEGFRVVDEKRGDTGVLREVADYTENVIMIIDFNGREILVPFHENIITGVDYDARIIKISAPEGLLDLYL